MRRGLTFALVGVVAFGVAGCRGRDWGPDRKNIMWCTGAPPMPSNPGLPCARPSSAAPAPTR